MSLSPTGLRLPRGGLSPPYTQIVSAMVCVLTYHTAMVYVLTYHTHRF